MTETTPESMREELAALYVSLNTALDTLSESFIAFKLEEPSTYEDDLVEVQLLRDQIVRKQNELTSINDIYKNDIEKFNFIITELTASNNGLKNQLKQFENSGLASHGELVIQKTIFNQYIIQNIILLLMILFFSYKLAKKESIF
jgi:hypothetical protein